MKEKARALRLPLRELVRMIGAETTEDLVKRWDDTVLRHAKKGGPRKRRRADSSK
jgi:hypothetical protein